jgi:DNA polymerase sigma
MSPITHIIDQLNSVLRTNYPDYVGSYLYGSQLSGKTHDDSDIDVALIFRREISWNFKNEIYGNIYGIMMDNDVVLDARVYSEIEMKYPSTPFREVVAKTGKFYAAA